MSHITYLDPQAYQEQMDQVLAEMHARKLGAGSVRAGGRSVNVDLLIQLASGKTVGFRRNERGGMELVTGTGEPAAEQAGRKILNRAVAAEVRRRLPSTRLRATREMELPDGSIQFELQPADSPQARVQLELGAGGEARVETFGLTGARCHVVTREIEAAIGRVARVVRKVETVDGRVAITEER